MSDTLAKAEPKQRDSLLISLKELRSIESRRIDTEQAEQMRLEREQRRSVEETELQAEEQRRLQEERECARLEAAEREERLRLAEAERRARVEAEMQLARERLKLELATPTADRRLGGAWGSISIFLVILLSGGLALVSFELHKRAEALRLAQQDQARATQLRGRVARTERALLLAQARIRDQTGAIRHLRDQLARSLGAATSTPQAPPRPPRRPPKRPEAKPQIGAGCADPDDPICGITEGKESRRRPGTRRPRP